MTKRFIAQQVNFLLTTAAISLILDIISVGVRKFVLLIWLRNWAIVYLLLLVISSFLPKLIFRIFEVK